MSFLNTCAICLDEMAIAFRQTESEEGLIGFPSGCTHCFHNECISEWAKIKNTCPTCRAEFRSMTIRSGIEGDIVRTIAVRNRIIRSFFTHDESLERLLNIGPILVRNPLFRGPLNQESNSPTPEVRPFSLDPPAEGTDNEAEQVSRVLGLRGLTRHNVNQYAQRQPQPNRTYPADNTDLTNTPCVICRIVNNNLGAECPECHCFTHFSCLPVYENGPFTRCSGCGLSNFVRDSEGAIDTPRRLSLHINSMLLENFRQRHQQHVANNPGLFGYTTPNVQTPPSANLSVSTIPQGTSQEASNNNGLRGTAPVFPFRDRILRDRLFGPRPEAWTRFSRENVSRTDLTINAFGNGLVPFEPIPQPVSSEEHEDEDTAITGVADDDLVESDEESFVETSHYSDMPARLRVRSSFHRDREYAGSTDVASNFNTISLRPRVSNRPSPLASQVFNAEDSDIVENAILNGPHPSEVGESSIATDDEYSEAWIMFETAVAEEQSQSRTSDTENSNQDSSTNSVQSSTSSSNEESSNEEIFNEESSHEENFNEEGSNEENFPIEPHIKSEFSENDESSSTRRQKRPLRRMRNTTQVDSLTSANAVNSENRSQTTIEMLLNSIRSPESSTVVSPDVDLSSTSMTNLPEASRQNHPDVFNPASPTSFSQPTSSSSSIDNSCDQQAESETKDKGKIPAVANSTTALDDPTLTMSPNQSINSPLRTAETNMLPTTSPAKNVPDMRLDSDNKHNKKKEFKNKGKTNDSQSLPIRSLKEHGISKDSGATSDNSRNKRSHSKSKAVIPNTDSSTEKPLEPNEQTQTYIISKASKKQLQSLVRDQLQPMLRDGKITVNEYKEINKKVSRQIYRDVKLEVRTNPSAFMDGLVDPESEEYAENMRRLFKPDSSSTNFDSDEAGTNDRTSLKHKSYLLVSVTFTETRLDRWKELAVQMVEYECSTRDICTN